MVTTHLKKNIKKEYDEIFAKRVKKEKIKAIMKWKDRKDYDAMLRVVENQQDDIDITANYKSESGSEVSAKDGVEL